MVGPRLKQRWSIDTLQQKLFAPAFNEAAAFENQAKIGSPSLIQGWGIGKLKQKWYAQPWKRLGIPKLQPRSYSSAFNKAGAFENCSGNGTPILKQGCRIGKLQQKWYAPACKEAAVLKNIAKMLKWPSLQLGWGIGRLPQNGMP